MDERTLTALKASIRHWEANVRAKTRMDASIGETGCALCVEFIKGNCSGCPVKAKTGRSFCLRTPHHAARSAWVTWGQSDAKSEDAWRKAAQAELDFLKSLLPEGQR